MIETRCSRPGIALAIAGMNTVPDYDDQTVEEGGKTPRFAQSSTSLRSRAHAAAGVSTRAMAEWRNWAGRLKRFKGALPLGTNTMGDMIVNAQSYDIKYVRQIL